MERLNCVKQLVFARTRLEFRLIWNKIFQKNDDELGWLLNPQATQMTSFTRNFDNTSTSYGYDNIQSITTTKKSPSNKKSFSDTAIQVARYMGMGVYMTSAAFPSPMPPLNEKYFYEEYPENIYTINRVW